MILQSFAATLTRVDRSGQLYRGVEYKRGGTVVEGRHIGALHVCRAGVVWDSIGGAGSLHGKGELGRTRLHERASIAMVPTISGWPPVSGHTAMVVAIEMQFRRAQERRAW